MIETTFNSRTILQQVSAVFVDGGIALVPGAEAPHSNSIINAARLHRAFLDPVVDLRRLRKGDEMQDNGSLIEQEDHDRALGRAFDAQDRLNAMRGEWWRRQQTISRMDAYGGSFVKSLAKTARLADEDNYKKLAAAFPEYWVKYGPDSVYPDPRAE